jgi:SEC-C motif domain protein
VPEDGHCPCGSGDDYVACCGPLHSGAQTAPTALALMRSRFTAFAVGDADYLIASWHRSTRPDRLDLDDDVRWRRLQIVDTVAGGPDDAEGVVEFRAQYERDGRRHLLHERSRFGRVKGRWVYIDGGVRD